MCTAASGAVMLALAVGKARTGRALSHPVLVAQGRLTLVDALLATIVLVQVALNAAPGWWWADPVAGLIMALYAAREARHSLSG